MHDFDHKDGFKVYKPGTFQKGKQFFYDTQ